jgi:hypothetical protein
MALGEFGIDGSIEGVLFFWFCFLFSSCFIFLVQLIAGDRRPGFDVPWLFVYLRSGAFLCAQNLQHLPFLYFTLPLYWLLWAERLPAWLYYIDVGVYG